MALARLNAAFLPQLPRQIHIRLISTSVANKQEKSEGEWWDRKIWVPPIIKEWKECPKDFKEFPERDLVNFPRPPKYLFSPKVRMGFISENLFNFFYKKTGVTGPYMLGVGVLAFLINKEIFVICDDTKHTYAFIILMWILNRFFGGLAAEQYDIYINAEDYAARKWSKNIIDGSKESIEKSKDIVARCEGWTDMLFQAQRDQVYLAMEEAYRKRLVESHAAVKRRMDYLVAFDEAKKQYQRRHIVDWVVDQVKKSITAQTQKAAFDQCLVNLQSLSAKAQI